MAISHNLWVSTGAAGSGDGSVGASQARLPSAPTVANVSPTKVTVSFHPRPVGGMDPFVGPLLCASSIPASVTLTDRKPTSVLRQLRLPFRATAISQLIRPSSQHNAKPGSAGSNTEGDICNYVCQEM